MPQVTIAASGPLSICQGESLTLTSSPANTYFWSNGGLTQAITVYQAGIYSVVVVGSNGCSNSSSQTIVIVNNNTTSTLNESALDSYTLNGQTYTQSGTYTQVIPNAVGCDSIITLNLELDFTGIYNVNDDYVKVYPNPTTTDFTIEITQGLIGEKYVIMDFSGRLLISGVLISNIEKIELDNFSNGVYIIEIKNSNIQQRIIKQ